MEINVDKLKKWCKESSLDIEFNTQQWSEDAIPEGCLRISGYIEDVTKCLVILMNHWNKKKK